MKRFEVSKHMPMLAAVLAGGLLLGGCSSTPAPTIHLIDVSTRETTPEGVVLEILLEADNTAERAIPLREVQYSLYIDGQLVFEGERSAEATIRRFGTQRVVLPAAFVPQTPAESWKVYRVEGTMTYLVPGVLAEALFDADVVRPSVSFRLEGESKPPAPSEPASN